MSIDHCFILNYNDVTLIEYAPVSDRLITARSGIANGNLTVHQVYAPTTDVTDEALGEFYANLHNTLNQTPDSDMTVVVMGDFNAKMGLQDDNSDKVLGKYGYGVRNRRESTDWQLLRFRTISGLHATNTKYNQKRDNRYWTWHSPDGRTSNQMSYRLVNRKGRGNLRNCRAFPSSDIEPD